MKSHCLPFIQIPHTTRLFADFLTDYPKVQPFYPRTPRFAEWLQEEAAELRYDTARRARVSGILEKQNKVWGASAKTVESLARLCAGAAVVVTGQQVGLLGGPLFSIFKALTAIKLAEEATRAGVDCVPVFWLATQDHDLEEVNQVSILGPDASLQKLIAPTEGVADAPVGTVTLRPEIERVVSAATGLLGESEAAKFIREAYSPHATLGNAFARLFARLFADWGVILLDASDPELQQVAAPIYVAAIERAVELEAALLARGKELDAAGYHQQVKVAAASTLLFTLHDSARVPVQRRPDGGSGSVGFTVEGETIAQPELLQRIGSAPHLFSANVLLRPVVQDYLLPTLAYTGGAAEVAYFAQAAVVYQALLGRVTPIVPRFSATVVEAKPQALLERYGLGLPELFHGPELLRERLAQTSLPQELLAAFDRADTSLKDTLAAITDSLSRLDKTLVEAAANASAKMHHQLDQLRSRAARAELQKTEVLNRHAELLSNALYPNKTLQEREIAGIYFVARHGPEFLHRLYEAIHTGCLDHQVISL